MKGSSNLIELRDKGFFKACSFKSLNEKEGKRIHLNDIDVALFKLDGKVYALSNICPHQQSALIYDGFVEDGCVTCPAHGWMFDIKTGKKPTGGNGLKVYDVKIIGEDVFVKAEQKKLKW